MEHHNDVDKARKRAADKSTSRVEYMFAVMDELPDPSDDNPDGWTGGAVYHSGGNIYLREFLNEADGAIISYDIDELDVCYGRAANFGDDDDPWYGLEDPLYEKECYTDAGALGAAQKMMELHNEGAISLDDADALPPHAAAFRFSPARLD